MRSINFRFVAMTLVCVLLIGGAVHAVHVMQYGKHVDFLKSLAQRADDAGDAAEAIGNYRRFVALKRDDPQAFERLGTLLAESNRRAEKEAAQAPLMSALQLRTTEGQEEDQLRVRGRLGDVTLALGRWSDAEHHLEQLIQKSPDDAELHQKMATCRIGQLRWKDAAEELKNTIRLDPTRTSAYEQLAWIYAEQLEDAASAVRCLEDLVSKNPESAEAWLIRCKFRVQYVSRVDEEVRRVEASLRQGANGDLNAVQPLTPDELLELAITDAQRGVELATAHSARASDAAAKDKADVVLLAAYSLAMQCVQLTRQSSDIEEIHERRGQAKDYAERMIKLCATRHEARVNELTKLRRERKLAQANALGTTISDADLEAAAALTATVKARLFQEDFKPAVPAYNVLAAVALREGDVAAAEKELKEGVKIVGNDEKLLWDLASLKLSPGTDVSNDPEFTSLIKQLSLDSTPLANYLLARALICKQSWAEALDKLISVRGTLTRWPTAMVEADYWIGNCYLMLGQPAEAQRAYARALNANPLFTQARWRLAQALEASDKPNEAFTEYETLVRNFGDLAGTVEGRELPKRYFIMASERLRSNQAGERAWEDLLQHVRKFREQYARDLRESDQLLILEAQLESDRGRLEQSFALIKEAADRNPQSVALWVSLSRIYDGQGNSQAAEAALRSVQAALVEASPSQMADLQLAEAQHVVLANGKGAATKLREMMDGLLESQTEEAASADVLRVLEGLGHLAFDIGDPETARRAFQTVREADADNFRVRLKLFDLALQSSTIEGETEQQRETRHVQQLKEMEELLLEIEHAGQEALLNYCRAVYHVVKADFRRGTTEAAPEQHAGVDDYAIARQHLSTAEKHAPKWGLIPFLQGHILLRGNERNEAATKWLLSFDNGYRPPEFVARLLVLLYELGRFPEAATRLLDDLKSEEAPQIELAQVAAGVSVAVMHEDAGQSRRLIKLAADFAGRTAENSQDPVHYLAYAQILLMQGDVERAVQQYQRIQELAPPERSVWLRLIDAYGAMSHSKLMTQEQAAAKINEALATAEGVLSADDLGLVAAQANVALGDRDQARQRFELELAGLPADLRDATAGQIVLMRQAADFFLQETPTDAGESPAETLLRRLDEDGDRVLTQLREERSATNAEMTALEVALAESVPLSRRRLAMLLTSRGRPSDLNEALDFINKINKANANSGGPTADDERLAAVILSRIPSRRPEAVAKLRKLVSGGAPRNDDRMLLATLVLAEYDRALAEMKIKRHVYGDAGVGALETETSDFLAEARAQTDAIVDKISPSDPGHASVLLLHINILLRSQDTEGAKDYLEQLKSAVPDSNVVTVTEASVQFAAGDHAGAIATLLSLATADGETAARNAQLSDIAKRLENLGIRAENESATDSDSGSSQAAAVAARYFDAAQQILLQQAPLSAGDQLSLSKFYSRRGRTDDALTLLETHWKSATTEEVVGAVSQIMTGGAPSAPSLDRLHDVLTAAFDEQRDLQSLQLLMADLYGLRGKIADAEQLYREVLAGDPKQVAAANNLAYLLASQKTQLDEAVDLIALAIDTRGESPDLLDTKAYVLLQRGDARGALEMLANVVAESPQPVFLYHLARAKMDVGQQTEAGRDWQLAVRVGLTDETIHPAERDQLRQFRSQIAAIQ